MDHSSGGRNSTQQAVAVAVPSSSHSTLQPWERHNSLHVVCAASCSTARDSQLVSTWQEIPCCHLYPSVCGMFLC